MRLITILLLLACLRANVALGQTTTELTLRTATGTVYGTLELPADGKKVPVVLIIPGSGPTDRDGNNMFQVNNSLKGLADSLKRRGIASVRYDKRGIGASRPAMPDESKLRFEYYVTDVADWVRLLQKDKRFSKVVVLGHSEGSLIGMMALANQQADGFISVAGPARPADELIMQQLRENGPVPASFLDSVQQMMKMVKAGQRIESVPENMRSMFRPSVQPYLASWMRYNPQAELPKIKVPTLIVQGTHDIQVGVEQARLLAAARPDARLVTVEGMNHIFRQAPADPDHNLATYVNADLPLDTKFVQAVAGFVWELK